VSRTVFAIVAVLVALVVAAAPAQASPPYAPETPIVTAAGTQSAPRFDRSGYSTMVWEDSGSGSWDAVWAPNFILPGTPVPAGTSAQRHPVVGGHYVVYEDDRAGNWDIYAYDTGQTPPPPVPLDVALTTNAADQLDPEIYGNSVVYEDHSLGNWDICCYDLSTGVERRLTANAADQVDPAIEGSNVVFADRRTGDWNIFCFNLDTGKLKRLTRNGAAQTSPQICRGRVVYQDHRNGNWDIYAYSLASGKERRLTTDSHDQTAPQIGRGRTVVYEDDRHGAADIYLCDLTSGVNRPVTDDPAAQTQPDICEDQIVWCDARAPESDIYGCQLAYPDFSFAGPSGTPRYGSSVTFHGTLSVPDSLEGGLKVQVHGLGRTRAVVVHDDDQYSIGHFSLTVGHVARKFTLRATYRGDTAHLPSETRSITVKPTALLTKPKLKLVWPITSPQTTLVHLPALFASGQLKPRHRAGHAAVVLEVWKQHFGLEWQLVKKVRVRVSDRSGYASYRIKLYKRVGAGDRWKVRAIHSDADHARTVSAFSSSVVVI
jgi:TolB protein